MVRLISVLWFHIWINWEATRHPILQSVFHSIQIWVVEKIKSYQMLSDCYNAIDTKFVCKIIQFHFKYLSETRNKWTRYFNEFKIYTTNNAGWFELSIKSSLEANFDPFQSECLMFGGCLSVSEMSISCKSPDLWLVRMTHPPLWLVTSSRIARGQSVACTRYSASGATLHH